MFNERVNVRYIAHKQAFANNQSVYREAEPVVDDNKNITKSMQYKRILRDGFWKLEYEQQRRIIIQSQLPFPQPLLKQPINNCLL